jgi:hypothetical protein
VPVAGLGGPSTPIFSAGIRYLTIGSYVTIIPSRAFQGNSLLTSVAIPYSITNIGAFAFQGCTGLITINVAANNLSYSSIDGVRFNKNQNVLILYPSGSPNTTYTIPSTVTMIESFAFENTNLISITSLRDIPPLLRLNAFVGVPTTACLYVPPASVMFYGVAEGWRYFTCILPIGGMVDKDAIIDSLTTLIGNLQSQNATLEDSIVRLLQLLADCEGTGTSNAPFIPTNQIQIYPNPVSYELRIINHEWEQDNVVELFDINGRRVFTGRGYGDVFTIDMSSFHPGNYILRIGHRVARVVRQ